MSKVKVIIQMHLYHDISQTIDHIKFNFSYIIIQPWETECDPDVHGERSGSLCMLHLKVYIPI